MITSKNGDLATFFLSYPSTSYRRGETIVRANDVPTDIYYVEKGLVRLYTQSLEGKEITLFFYVPGQFFPLSFVLSEQPSSYYFESVVPTQIRRARKTEFTTFMESHNEVKMYILNELVVRMRALLRHVELLALFDAKKRVQKTIHMLTNQFGKKIGKAILIHLPLTHKDIALYAGVTRETASLEIERLQKEKVIRHKGKYFTVLKVREL